PPDALILVPVDDWALRYYLLPQVENLREALATVLYLEVDRMSDEEVEALVSAERQERSTAALVRWHQGTSDHRGLLDYLLERAGAQVGVQHLPGYTVVRYALQDKPAPLLIVEQEARFEKLALLRAAIETDVPADDAVAVALTFNPLDDLDQDFKVSLEVTDQAGHPLARQDTLLEDREGEETGEWMAQVPVTTYHILPLTPGLAPLTYTVDVGVYAEEEPEGLDLLDQAGAPAGKRYVLGSIHLREPSYQAEEEPDRERLGLVPLSQSPPAEGASAQQLVLAAHSALAEGYDTGQMLDVLLEWHHVGTSSLPDLRPVLRLVREGVVLAAESAAPVYGQYPTDRWRPGEVVLDRRAIQVPLDAAEGPAIVQVVVEGYKPWTLGQIDIHRIARTFAPPSPKLGASGRLGEVAELVGYDLAVEAIRAGQEIPLTLYWRALSTPDIDYVVFTHLLSEKGELIAQHDGPPARGTRPTRGWLAGEYILDEHLLEWLKPDYRGVALLEVGLYDPATGTRLLTPEGDSRLLLGNGTMVR
ncbi:MAG: hypothetical protein H5T69_07150, partial [Chloroflexi bacterium]|nr:hypothetical protein [Chloroflexota bacterium]